MEHRVANTIMNNLARLPANAHQKSVLGDSLSQSIVNTEPECEWSLFCFFIAPADCSICWALQKLDTRSIWAAKAKYTWA